MGKKYREQKWNYSIIKFNYLDTQKQQHTATKGNSCWNFTEVAFMISFQVESKRPFIARMSSSSCNFVGKKINRNSSSKAVSKWYLLRTFKDGFQDEAKHDVILQALKIRAWNAPIQGELLTVPTRMATQSLGIGFPPGPGICRKALVWRTRFVKESHCTSCFHKFNSVIVFE